MSEGKKKEKKKFQLQLRSYMAALVVGSEEKRKRKNTPEGHD
jgi:hypothetical protein